jgi:DNA-binding NarL/FixJ family response regulator
MTKILIADDHAIVRSGMRQLLADHDFMQVGEAATGPAALEACRQGGWDLLLLDVTLPGRSGVQVLRDLRRDCPALPIIMVSFYLDADYIRQCLDAGAAGYVAKETLPEDLLAAVQAVLTGQSYVSQGVIAALEEAPSVRKPPAE